MAHFMRWYQGEAPFEIPKCDDKFPFTCPKSKRTAAEYNRGHFTHTAVIVPNSTDGQYVEPTLDSEVFAEAKVGDYIWCVLVPPMHHISDVFAYNDTLLSLHGSSFTTFGGISLSLVTAEFKEKDKDGNCQMQGAETNHGTLVFPEGNDAKKQFLRKGVDITTDTETYVGIGFKIDALPAKRTIADIMGKIAMGGHTVDYQSQDFQ